MPRHPHHAAAAELLDAILSGTLPADAQMERFFRAHPKLGVHDRGVIAETVYTCLRRRRTLAFIATGHPGAPATAAELIAALVERARAPDGQSLPPALRLDLPDWLYERLLDQYGEEETALLARALNEPATLDLRVNTLKATRDEAAACLAAAGFPAEPTPYSPVGLRRRERAPLFKTRCFRDGLIEVQDEGSQLLSLLVEPRRQEMVVDFCAGAGGKTLQLGTLMANSGSLYAFDVSGRRLERLKPRLARAGLSNVRSVVIASERDARVRRLEGKIDRVLVDAPCSGTGTLRRSPDIKWRRIDLDRITATQRAILAAAAALLKPGGRLVYATCSLLREENEDVVTDFLSSHVGFTLLPVNEVLARRNISLHVDGDILRLLPHRHHTDGFFAAVLERR